MKTAVIALTRGGSKTALTIGNALKAEVYLKYPVENRENAHVFSKKLSALVADIYRDYQAFVLVMATGIAFRTFAPYIQSKDQDPALVVTDEKGAFAISLLSGHLGGANDLARKVAAEIGATPVITTATDVNDKPAFDNIAKKNGFLIEDLTMTQHISGALVNGEAVALLSRYPVEAPLPDCVTDYETRAQKNVVLISNRAENLPEKNVLILRPQNLILGVGCRRNTAYEAIKEAFDYFMADAGYSPLSLKAMASVDLKKEEPGLLLFSQREKLPFLTFSSEALNTVKAEGGVSDFVKSVTGTPSVSQSAALYASKNGKTVVRKTIVNGITFSLAEEPTKVSL